MKLSRALGKLYKKLLGVSVLDGVLRMIFRL